MLEIFIYTINIALFKYTSTFPYDLLAFTQNVPFFGETENERYIL